MMKCSVEPLTLGEEILFVVHMSQTGITSAEVVTMLKNRDKLTVRSYMSYMSKNGFLHTKKVKPGRTYEFFITDKGLKQLEENIKTVKKYYGF